MTRRLTTTTVLSLPFAGLALLLGCSDRPAPPPAAGTAGEARVAAVVRPYLELNRLLVADKFEGVPERLAEVRTAAEALADSGDTQVKDKARAVAERAGAKVGNVKEAREALKGVSEAVVELVKAAPPDDPGLAPLYVAYCPMAKARWLQTSKELANPYMGQEMPKCGEIKEEVRKA